MTSIEVVDNDFHDAFMPALEMEVHPADNPWYSMPADVGNYGGVGFPYVYGQMTYKYSQSLDVVGNDFTGADLSPQIVSFTHFTAPQVEFSHNDFTGADLSPQIVSFTHFT